MTKQNITYCRECGRRWHEPATLSGQLSLGRLTIRGCCCCSCCSHVRPQRGGQLGRAERRMKSAHAVSCEMLLLLLLLLLCCLAVLQLVVLVKLVLSTLRKERRWGWWWQHRLKRRRPNVRSWCGCCWVPVRRL